MKRDRHSFSTELARALSKLGYCSRSVASRMVLDGKVEVNGRVTRNPRTYVDLGKDQLSVNDVVIQRAPHVYLLMNKPRGLVTTTSDEKGRKTVFSLLPADRRWLAPVGRLDMASEGVLLFTNDSGWAARISSPESHLRKVYHVQIAAVANEKLVERLIEGVRDGKDFLMAKEARILRLGKKNSWVEIVLDEGKNRHIRRMLKGLGMEVLRLVRVAIGTLQLGDLPKGGIRELTPEEIGDLRALVS